MGIDTRGSLVLIGGGEDLSDRCAVLRRVVELARSGAGFIVVITVASEAPLEAGRSYVDAFKRLGIGGAEILAVASRDDARDPRRVEILDSATGAFFTGGDQLRITSNVGGTQLDDRLHALHRHGAVIAGTSAGASAMSSTMIVGGPGDDPPKKCTTSLAPGMGFLEEVVVDQHFADRGRIGRLLAAVAQNPYVLGVGIDEDTAIEVSFDSRFTVLGSQTVTVVDGRGITVTNASEQAPDEPLALADVSLHVLPAGYGFDLRSRRPLPPA